MKGERSYALEILNRLMVTNDYMTTQDLIEATGCDRKTVYHAIGALEISGFHIEVKTGCHRLGEKNKYKYSGLYGF